MKITMSPIPALTPYKNGPNSVANAGGVNPDDVLFASNRANRMDNVDNNDCVCSGASERNV